MKEFKQLKTMALAALAMTLGLTACSDDDSSEPAPKANIAANGIVLMDMPDEVVNGDTAILRFRINPSTAEFTKEQLHLDCVKSNIYKVKIDKGEERYNTRAFYVTPSGNLSIIDLHKDSLNGEALDGQWVAKIKAETSDNIFDKSDWALVIGSRDQNQDSTLISSDAFKMDIIPTPQDGVFAWSPDVYSLYKLNYPSKTPSTEVIPAYWILRGRDYHNTENENEVVTYDVNKRITKCYFDVPALNGVNMFAPQDSATATNCKFLRYKPDMKSVVFSSLKEKDVDNVMIPSKFTFSDNYGHETTIQKSITYTSVDTVTVYVDCPENLKAGVMYNVDVEQDLETDASFNYDVASKMPAFIFHQYLVCGAEDDEDDDLLIAVPGESSDQPSVSFYAQEDCKADDALKQLSTYFKQSLDYKAFNEPNGYPIWNTVVVFKRKGTE